MKKIVLCILDGVGIREENYGNAVKLANMPNFNMLYNKYPHSLLNASGNYVGLPKNQMGNSEVGHQNIGAGRIVYQSLEIINNAIDDGSFSNNNELLNVLNHVKQNQSKLHICGLLSDGGVHSHINHLFKIIELCKINNIKEVYYHLFLDGRDTKPDSGIKYIKELQKVIDNTNIGSIATISGRYYAMDRDNRWERIEKVYNAMVNGNSKKTNDIINTIEDSYNNNIFDEFVEPFIYDINGTIDNKDGIIVFNYRPDRLRELFSAISNQKFDRFPTKKLKDIKLVTMFPVSDEVICTNAFYNQNLSNTLGEYLESKDINQLRIAETEKYAHVTYFFDGGKEIDLIGKDQILIPSPKVKTYDLKPEMSAYIITETLIEKLKEQKYEVVILNYANGDMVGHTGNLEKTIEALEHLDVCLGNLYNECLNNNYLLIITADHGNSDYMLDSNNEPVTSHSNSRVPFIITDEQYQLIDGALCDIAPTILEILNITIPKEMTGKSLIEKK